MNPVCGNDLWHAAPEFRIAEARKALAVILLPSAPANTQRFAAAELARYLQQISGASFLIVQGSTRQPAISLQIEKTLAEESYTIRVSKQVLALTAGSGRALLYAVYDLLHRLGCEWLAPQFSFYQGQSEYIPSIATVRYTSGAVTEHPRMAIRKLDVEEGRSHNSENLQQLIDWMPKVRLNVLMVPLNYQGAGRVQWDHWRNALIPELKKRGILLEVGGHGYQNFINPHMEQGTLFHRHPDWFGKNKNGQWDSTRNLVFNTANPPAVRYFINHIIAYLRAHPEIDIFDCWPPDVAKWAESDDMKMLGSPLDRQAALLNQVDSALRAYRLSTRLEMIAYGQVLLPPQEVTLNKQILVDICPINQSFEQPIYDTAHANNAAYAAAIRAWRNRFKGNIGLYSYYRKYAWRSRPVIFPHFIQKELQWYAGLPLQGISTYAEPGDWYTYELNHYTLAALAWDPSVPVDALIKKYCKIRYGSQAAAALTVYSDLERILPRYSGIPYTTLKAPQEIRRAQAVLAKQYEFITGMAKRMQEKRIAENLHRLGLMLRYADLDLRIRRLQHTGNVPDQEIKMLTGFLEAHAHEGVFIVRKDNFKTFLSQYRSP
ncbi:DUF4838 domain-containing protein [Niabella ginsenosidivorans]|uniref:DUF4838 domain-containing protein n=1 Tax=Niabella ginsenosidivorans TaxID=1176587 RepID=UPI0014724A5B|nr:DUF4838 domain-containing protein [Niabella ginsenosidivorans]